MCSGGWVSVTRGGRQLCRSWAFTHNWRKEFRKCSQPLRHLGAQSQAGPKRQHPEVSKLPGGHQVRRPRHHKQPECCAEGAQREFSQCVSVRGGREQAARRAGGWGWGGGWGEASAEEAFSGDCRARKPHICHCRRSDVWVLSKQHSLNSVQRRRPDETGPPPEPLLKALMALR